MQTVGDIQLLKEFSTGNERAFEVLMQRHAVAVKGYAIRMLQNVELAEEVCAGTFLRVALGRGKWDERGASFRSYVFTIAHRLCLDILRKQKVARLAADGVLELAQHQQVRVSPEAQAILGQDASVLEQAVGRLKPDLRQVIVLRCIYGFSAKETANVMECSPSQVDSSLSYAKKILRNTLTELAAEYSGAKNGGLHGNR